MKLAAYLRVSTERQADEGLGLDVQRESIKTWARSAGHSVTLWAADEGVSGSQGLDARLGLLDALGALQERAAEGLVVYRLDRLARDLVVQEQILADVWRLGSRVFSTSPAEDAFLDPNDRDADPSRALIRQILGAVAQYERGMIRLRMKSGKARKRAKGGFIGGQVPFGYRSDAGTLIADQVEQQAVAQARAMRADGHSLRSIAQALDAEGLPPKKSIRWHPQTVSNLLKA
jgi:DNA invertase Pin-like site-specific DNA recombinase